MKTRTSFVSNSSSSSFICVVCGNHEEGMDLSIGEAGMFECENGHVVCESEMLNDNDEDLSEVENYPYETPERFCPVCRLTKLPWKDLADYHLKKEGKTRQQATDEIRTKFGTYKNFKNFVK